VVSASIGKNTYRKRDFSTAFALDLDRRLHRWMLLPLHLAHHRTSPRKHQLFKNLVDEAVKRQRKASGIPEEKLEDMCISHPSAKQFVRLRTQ